MLSAAAQRADGAIELPENSEGTAAQKAATRLLREGLVEEVLAGRDLPAWRRDESDQPVALLITALGKETIGVTEEGAAATSPGARLLRVMIALLLRRKDEASPSLKQQIETLHDLGLRPSEIAEVLGRSGTHINKELSAIRKGRKR